MAFFSNAQETSGRYGGYIAEFQELFGKYGMKFGKPADFLQLPSKLAYDEKFRSDFTELTKSVAQRDEGRLTVTRMLTIIAVALGGTELEKIEKNAVSISLVVVYLAGVGGWSKSESEPERVAPKIEVPTVKVESPVDKVESPVSKVEKPVDKVENPVSKLEESGGWGAVVAALNEGAENDDEEREALELEQRLAAGTRGELEGLTTSLFGGTALVKEALSRLEMNTLELKHHLDSIDHRMERIEPHLDDLTARISTADGLPAAATNELPNGLPMLRFSHLEEEEPRVEEQVVEDKPVAAPKEEEAAATDLSKPGVVVEDRRRLYWAAAALGILLLGGAASMVFFGKHARGVSENRIVETVGAASQPNAMNASHGLDPPDRGGGHGGAAPGAVLVGNQRAATRQVEKQRIVAGAGQGGADRNGPNQAGLGTTGLNQTGPENTPVDIRTEFGNRPGKIHVAKEESPPVGVANNVHIAAALPGSVVSTHLPSVAKAAETSASVPPGVTAKAPDASAVAVTHRAVFVPATTLSHNLIAGPKPAYPQVAHFQRTEGDVMLRAVISETGAVESVTVMSGPGQLRQAAVDAMRNWRYKPYLINGKPVQVQTYIDFHFSLER